MARAQGVPPLFNHGLRWIGSAATCQAPGGWTASRLFRSGQLGAALDRLCVYRWNQAGTLPTQSDIADLFTVSGSDDLTEDVPVVYQSAAFSPPEIAFLTGLRTALSAQVGNATLLPHAPGPQTPAARVVVVDTAPDAPHGQIHPGVSRHGDTLAHLIEDLVCLPATPTGWICAAEVTTALALDGGVGTLSDLASAIERAVVLWQSGRRDAPATTPAHLILNLSLGWENQPGIADCSTQLSESAAPPVRAVAGILQYAAAQGALIIAAAGNDSGGPKPRTGLVCPGRYQAVPRDADPKQSLVVAVSGVDYQDRPLATARPLGITGIAGLGFGGVAWNPADPVPPPLTGSSVSTAVVSAVSALVWSQQATWNAAQITRAVYNGGVAVGPANECPLAIPGCASHRASLCGALHAAGIAVPCAPAAPYPGSNPALPTEIAEIDLAFGSLPPTAGTAAPTAAPLPRDTLPGLQIQPWIYPMPIAETCPVCVVENNQLLMPALTRPIDDTVLVVRYADGTEQEVALAPPLPAPTTLASGIPYWFALPGPPSSTSGPIVAAYLTAYAIPPALPPYSISEPLFVEP
ncbi:MAG TPA: S8/S53 family peptidase [Kofleriaceae bacterium]